MWEHGTRRRRTSCTSATACAPSRCRSSWCHPTARRSTRSTRPRRRRCTGCSSCTGCSPTCPPRSTCGPSTGSRSAGEEEPARSLARAMVCSAAAFHAPEDLVVAVLCSERQPGPLGLAEVAAARAERPSRATPSARRRMVTTSLDDLGALLPPDLSDRPRFGADERPADAAHPARHRRRAAAAGQPHHPARRPARRHRARPAGALGRARRPDPAAPRARRDAAAGARPGCRCTALRVRAEPVQALGDQCDLATAEAFARRLAPLHTVCRRVEASGEITGPTDFMDLLGLGDVHTFDPAPPGGRGPRATGCGCRSGVGETAARSTSTSRSRPSRAWARTAW